VRVPGDSTPDHSSWTHGRWVPTRAADVGPNSTTWSCVRVGQVSDPGIPADDQPGISDQRGQPVKIRSAGQHRVSAEASGSGHSILGAQQDVVDICSLVPQTAAPQLACEASGWVVTRSPQTMAYPRGRCPNRDQRLLGTHAGSVTEAAGRQESGSPLGHVEPQAAPRGTTAGAH
jgi:hypothetical protein